MTIMDADQTDNLFLLEVLVKEVQYNYENIKLDKSYLEKLRGTCVVVKFLHYPPLEIHQEAADGVDFNSPTVRMGTGKSCLFSLNKNKIMTNQKLNMVLNVVRLSDDCGKSKCVHLGKATVDMSKNVAKLMKLSCSSAAPTTQCIDDTLSLINDQVEKIGSVSVFVRISCFGNQITTQFKMSGDDKESFVFRGADQKEILENLDCFSSNSFQDGFNNGYFGADISPDFRNNMDCPNFGFPGMGLPPVGPGVQGVPFPISMGYQEPPYQMPYPAGMDQNFQYQQYGGIGGVPAASVPGEGIYQYGKPLEELEELYPGVKLPRPPAEPRPCQCRRSVSKPPSTEVPTAKSKKGSSDQQMPKEYPFCQRVTIGESESEDETKSDCPKLNLCDCDYPVPPGLASPCPPRKKKKVKPPCPLDVQPGDYCLRADCPCGLPIVPWLAKPEEKPSKERSCEKFTLAPGSVGVKGKQFIYQMNEKNVSMSPEEKKFISSTQYKVGTIGDKDGQKNVIQVLPQINRDPTADKERDIFILKVGKKNDLNKKAKLEIELRSPKLEDKTPQKRETETQWLESDVPPVRTAGKKSDSKGGKKDGKKGGKKKKK